MENTRKIWMNQSDFQVLTLDGVAYVRADTVDRGPSDWQIVIAQRGWVFVGRVVPEGDEFVIYDARNIRRWGTTKGLGELVNGPLPATQIDPYGTVRVHHLAVVACIDVDAEAWSRT